MSEKEPLDLNQVDPAVWRVLVNDQLYGPYTLGQLRSFVSEGRLGQRSKIIRGEGSRFIDAGDCPALADTFVETQSANGRQDKSNYVVIVNQVHDEDVLVETLNGLGIFGEAMPGVFLLRSDQRLSAIQSQFAEISECCEKIMIVDATNNRLAWHGLGFDNDKHLRSIWKRDANTSVEANAIKAS